MITKGTRFGPYEVVEKIGQGGMGVVYRAREQRLQRDVALKILSDRLAGNPAFTKRFVREAQAAARIEHPGIVSIYGVGEENGAYWLAMHLVSGRPLSESMTSGPLPVDRALDIAKEMGEALDYAHRQGVIHRDIKPDNIMIDESGRVKIMDFGLAKAPVFDAKITESGVYLGTPEYSSPEQCETQEVDGRSDLYSLGVVIYEALTGQVPHSAETPYSLFKKIVDDPPTPLTEINPEIPAPVVAIVDRLMEKDRDKRYQTGRELVNDIDKAQGLPASGVSSGTETAILATKVQSREKRRMPLFSVLAASGLAFTALAVLLFLAFGNRTGSEEGGTSPGPAPLPAPATVPGSAASAEPATLPVVALVLDFKNPTKSAELAWMRIGVPDMLITDLAQLSWLRVRSRERVISEMDRLGLRSTDEPHALARLAEALEADILIKGTFIEVAGKVKITVQVIAHPDDDLILSDHITGNLDDLLSMLDELTLRIRRGLQARFRPKEKEEDELVSLEQQVVEVSASFEDSTLDVAPASLPAEFEALRKMMLQIKRQLEASPDKGLEILRALKEKKISAGKEAAGALRPAPSGSPASKARRALAEKEGIKVAEDKKKTKAEPASKDELAEGSVSRFAGGRDAAPEKAGVGKDARGKRKEGKKSEKGAWVEEEAEAKDREASDAPSERGKKPHRRVRRKALRDGKEDKRSLNMGRMVVSINLPEKPMVRAIMLTYKAKNTRELKGNDLPALLEAYVMIQEALKLNPRLKIARLELKELMQKVKTIGARVK